MSLQQREIDWDDAARKGAAKDRRILLTRIKQALAGRTLGDLSDPRSCVSGAVVAVVLDGLYGWCVTDGRTDRKPGEIGRPYSESRAKRALAYLQSPEAECCVSVDPFRSHGSPRNWRSICWSNLHAWCERLEAEPVVRKESVKAEKLVDTTGADRTGHRCGPHLSTGADRDSHRCGPHRSYNEDGPKTVQTVPTTEPTGLLSEAEADQIETITRGGEGEDFESSRAIVLPGVRRTHHEKHVPATGSPTRCHRPGHDSHSTIHVLGDDRSPDSQQTCVRSHIEQILHDQLKVDAAATCVDIALRTQTIKQIAEVVRYAAGQAVGEVQAWGPGFVFQRVSRPPSDAQRPEDGWAKRRPEWMLAKARHAERERREREERRLDAERQLRNRRKAVEEFYGPVIDRMYREDKHKLLAKMTRAEHLQIQACGGTFHSRGVRDLFLLAAIEGRFG